MDARELLAKLAPHGIRLDAISFGGIPELTALDVAAAIGMAHLDELANVLLRVRYCGDASCWDELRLRWWLHVHDVGIRESWPRPTTANPTWLLFAMTSLLEHCHANICKACGGTKERTIDAKIELCPFCRGAGRRTITERKLARVAGVSREKWQSTFAPCLAVCRAELQTIDDRAVSRVARRLRATENA